MDEEVSKGRSTPLRVNLRSINPVNGVINVRFVMREHFPRICYVLCRDIEVGNPLCGVDVETDRSIECSFVEVVPRAKIEERTMGNVAGPCNKFDGSVPHCQVGDNARVAGKSLPQKCMVVDSDISRNINA